MYSELINLLPAECLKIDEPMKKHTTFKIGGPVDLMVLPRNTDEIKITINFCRENQLPILVLGMGSNILVRDKGIRGVAIKLGNNFKKMQIHQEVVYAQAGIRLSELAKKTAEYSLSGLEFGEGIPGSLGGAIVMNAGAYDGEMKNVVSEVEAISQAGEIKTFYPADFGFDYRKSIFQVNGYIVLTAKMSLKLGNKDDIQSKMRDYARSRRDKQPLELPSAGSVFKRPPGFYVGPMVEQMGLKGLRIGGAEVSAKHAGFIVNSGNAMATDVLELIDKITIAAREQFGIDLHPEIKVVGEQ